MTQKLLIDLTFPRYENAPDFQAYSLNWFITECHCIFNLINHQPTTGESSPGHELGDKVSLVDSVE